MKKLLCLFLLVSSSLFAQAVSPSTYFNPYIWLLIPTASKTVIEYIEKVTRILVNPPVFILLPQAEFNSRRVEASQTTSAAPVVVASMQTGFSALLPVAAPFYSYFSGGEVSYNPLFQPRSAAAVRPDLTTVQPVAPPDAQMFFLDGFGDGLVDFDMTTLAPISQVPVPTLTGPFGLRPNATGPANEVWVLNSGFEVPSGLNEVSVVDLSAQSLVTNIVTPSIQAAVPVGIVFANDGATAFEALKYDSPDSAGNTGALLVFDAAARTVTSTMPLKFVPTALLMAPDGITAYILSNTGTITYYDVLSGTADLTVSTYPPGSNAGYPGAGSAVFIHPDGTRLFWNVGVYLTVFDLTSRTVTNQFNFDQPTTASQTFSMSKDGTTAYFSDVNGDVALVDTYYGTVLASFNAGAPAPVFGGPPVAP